MNIIKGFSLAVHWGSLLTGIISALTTLYINVLPNLYNIQRFGLIVFALFAFFSCSGLGWLARYTLVGKVHFLPWKKIND